MLELLIIANIVCTRPLVPHEQMVKYLLQEYKEIPIFIGVTSDNQGMMELFYNPENNTTTQVATDTNKCSIIVGEFTGFFNIPSAIHPEIDIED